jgi:hypothetical protein
MMWLDLKVDGAQKHEEILFQLKTLLEEHAAAAIANVSVLSAGPFACW